ncbi:MULTISPECIES: S8 family serine peptidase [unclassified Rudaea]|nr:MULTISPECIES: S8 family serine peptidase [unclassified Rudaea]
MGLISGSAAAQNPQNDNAAKVAYLNPTGRYFVHYAEPSVAAYNRASASASSNANGSASLQANSTVAASMATATTIDAIPYRLETSGRHRLDVDSREAQAYVSRLESVQSRRLADIRQTLQRNVQVVRTFSYALNASVIEMTGEEAARVAKLPGVARVEPVRQEAVSDDVSTKFIGAHRLWTASSRPLPGDATFTFPTLQDLFGTLQTPSGFKGDGVVVGDIDTGYNSLSPSFQATDASGYTITNPLGSGKYLGDCAVAGISLGGCNDKVIGVYDKIHATDPTQLPFFSVEDYQGHGSHTASTAAGNARSAQVDGFTSPTNISGIAPHANLMVFFVCENPKSCGNDASAAAAEQAIKDGLVHVLNFSIGGGSQPWDDSVSQAFLAAEGAGIFVAAAAGNTGDSIPIAVPGSANHLEPWTLGVAATTDTGGSPANFLSLTSPVTPPGNEANTQNVPAYLMDSTPPLTAALPNSTPYLLSPTFKNADTTGSDGCAPFPANTFKNAVALLSRGTCNFSVKAVNAATAGAIAAVIADNRPEAYPGLNAAGSSIPVFYLGQQQGAVQARLLQGAGSVGGTVSLSLLARAPQVPDVLANFSLWGPASFDVLKPEIAAPGVAVLAAFNNQVRDTDTKSKTYLQELSPQTPETVGFDSGTSMATPHITGSAALLMGLHPDWTPMEVKSALMMTASEANLINANDLSAVVPADYFKRGAGRVQVDVASRAGLVLNETVENMQNANPAKGGDPSTLNLASLQKAGCAVQCRFTRTFHSTLSSSSTWTTWATGELGNRISVTPAQFSVPAGGEVSLTFTVNTKSLTPDDTKYHFGEVQLSQTADLPQAFYVSPTLHIPLAVAVPTPTLLASTNKIAISLNGQPSGSANLNLTNPGDGTMLFNTQTAGAVAFAAMKQPALIQSGYNSTHVLASGNYYMADDFTIPSDGTALTQISVDGFVNSGAQKLTDFGSSLGLHWRIYADNQGVPAGNPDNNDNAVWKYDATAASAGVTVGGAYGSSFVLNLTAAKLNTVLPKGHYWLVVYPDLPCNANSNGKCTFVWNWFTSNAGDATLPVQVNTTNSGSSWSVPSDLKQNGLAATITTQAGCSAPPAWLSIAPGSGVAPSASTAQVKFTATSAGFAPQASASALVCLGTGYQNDFPLVLPRATIPVLVNASN